MYSKEKIMQTLHDINDEAKQIGPYVVIAQPRRSETSPQAQSLNGHMGLHIDFCGFSHGYIESTGMPVDSARNYLIDCALETNAEYLFFVGDDTVSPWKAFKILHETSLKNPNAVIAGVYYIKISDAMVMVNKNNTISVPNVDPGQVLDVWQTGMDCMLIPMRILRKMKEKEPELPFCCIAHEIEGIPFVGEDNFFVHRLRKHGYKLLVNTDVQCLHMDVYTGKYTAHPNVNLDDYYTNIPITEPLTMKDKKRIDNVWATTTTDTSERYLKLASGE